MTDSSVPFDRDEVPSAEELENYDAAADSPADVADEKPVLPEFEGVDITEREGPDLEAGNDLDTGAAVQGD